MVVRLDLRLAPGKWTDDTTRFAVIDYPGWKRLTALGDFSADVFIADLRSADRNKGATGTDPHRWPFNWGPFRLRSCASPPGDGSRNSRFLRDRYLYDQPPPRSVCGVEKAARLAARLRTVAGERRFGEFTRFLRSKFWRALFRLAGSRLPSFCSNDFRHLGNLPRFQLLIRSSKKS